MDESLFVTWYLFLRKITEKIFLTTQQCYFHFLCNNACPLCSTANKFHLEVSGHRDLDSDTARQLDYKYKTILKHKQGNRVEG